MNTKPNVISRKFYLLFASVCLLSLVTSVLNAYKEKPELRKEVEDWSVKYNSLYKSFKSAENRLAVTLNLKKIDSLQSALTINKLQGDTMKLHSELENVHFHKAKLQPVRVEKIAQLSPDDSLNIYHSIQERFIKATIKPIKVR